MDALSGLANEIEFGVWYERELERVAEAINLINQIDSAEKFYAVRDLLRQAAAVAGVPRAWFDHN